MLVHEEKLLIAEFPDSTLILQVQFPENSQKSEESKNGEEKVVVGTGNPKGRAGSKRGPARTRPGVRVET